MLELSEKMPPRRSFKLSLDVSPENNVTEIIRTDGTLYLGDAVVAHDLKVAQKKGITHVVNCTNSIQNFFGEGTVSPGDHFGLGREEKEEPRHTYYRVPCFDSAGAATEMFKHFRPAAAFIHNALSNNHSVLVHCQMGMSRSPTILMAYLMLYHDMRVEEAYEFITSKRFVFPNKAFIGQLYRLQAELDGGAPAVREAMEHFLGRRTLIK